MHKRGLSRPWLLLFTLIIIISACDSAEPTPQETETPATPAFETITPEIVNHDQETVQETPPQPTLTPSPEIEVESYLDVQPAKALADEPVVIQAGGLEPSQLITLTASMRDDLDRKWESSATFVVDDDGIVDVATQAPITGTYTTVDSMGLFWSMLPATTIPSDNFTFFVNGDTTSRLVTVKAEVDGKQMATAYTERLRLQQNINKKPIDEDGLVGSLFTPAAEGSYPALIILGGSDGRIDASKAAMLASHGYVTLALDYFGNSPLPPALSEIPLEYFKTAIDWLQTQENVDADKIGVVGSSRGGELALLLGATYPEITAVVGYVPSGVVFGGLSSTNPGKSAWTFEGTPVPFVTSEETVAQSTIPVEQINGPILLISGKDDQTWPSAPLSEIAIERLQENDHPYPYEHLSYEEAGHGIGLPYWPTTSWGFARTVAGQEYTWGGTPQGNAVASVDSWTHLLTFLADAFGNPSP